MMQKSLCGWPPPARGLRMVLATRSGAVICPARSCGGLLSRVLWRDLFANEYIPLSAEGDPAGSGQVLV
jgi:hypothetical protein